MVRKLKAKYGAIEYLTLSVFVVLTLVGQARATACHAGWPDLTVLAFGQAADPAAAKLSPAILSRVKPTVLELEVDNSHGATPPPQLSLYTLPCRRVASLTAGPRPKGSSTVVGLYRKIGPLVQAMAPGVPAKAPEGLAARMRTFDLIVLSNAKAGRDAEFNRWYDTEHLPDVLKIPGFETGQRFELVSNLTPSVFQLPRYAVRFILRSVDLQATITEVRRRLATGVTRPGPDFDMATSISRYYRLKK